MCGCRRAECHYSNQFITLKFTEINAVTIRTVERNPSTAKTDAEINTVRIMGSWGSAVFSDMLADKRTLRHLSNHSWRKAFTGSILAANHAGISAANEQIAKALTQMIRTSEGTTSAGISLNW